MIMMTIDGGDDLTFGGRNDLTIAGHIDLTGGGQVDHWWFWGPLLVIMISPLVGVSIYRHDFTIGYGNDNWWARWPQIWWLWWPHHYGHIIIGGPDDLYIGGCNDYYRCDDLTICGGNNLIKACDDHHL